MSREKRRNNLRKRLIRDLVVAAAVIVLVLAYFIPGIVSAAQDLSVANRRVSYEAETIRFSGDNSYFAERLRMMSGSYWSSQDNYVVIGNGHVYNSESAKEEAKNQLLILLSEECTGYDVIAETLEKAVFPDTEGNAEPVLVVGEESGEPFIVWLVKLVYFDQAEIGIILDDSTGKILLFAISDWYNIFEDLQSVAYIDHTKTGAGIAKYYGMNLESYRIYMEEPYAITFSLEKDGEKVKLPVTVWNGDFSFNSPIFRDMLYEFGFAEDEEPEAADGKEGEELIEEAPAEEYTGAPYGENKEELYEKQPENKN